MKCKFCHKELKEGRLYCEHCGRPVQMVPNFEPEIEAEIDETLSAIAVDEVIGAAKPATEPPDGKKKPFPSFFPIIVILFIAGFAAGVFLFTINHTYSAYYEDGMQAIEDGNLEQALSCFNKALLKEEDSLDARLQIAHVYYRMGDDAKALRGYLDIIEEFPDCRDAYQGAITIYEDREDYLSINRLLGTCKVDAVYNEFREYLALPPQFSEEEGIYHERLMIKLMTDNKGTIYYTLDGSEPGKESLVYKAPIALNPGNNVIRAVFVNEMGIISDSVSRIYEIELLKPEPPHISPVSGNYILPQSISASVPDECEVYYTTDGTDPTSQSEKYEGPVAMPLNGSSFKFIAYSKNNKIYSSVVSVTYHLDFNGACTPEVAANYTAATLAGKGKILDANGTAAGMEGQYKYRCESAITEGSRYFYIIDEYYLPENGEARKTGDVYAVNAFDFTICTVERNPEGKLVFQFL